MGGFMSLKYKVFLLNLDISKDRLEYMSGQFAKLGIEFERISAVYGKDLTPEEISKNYSETLNKKFFAVPLHLGQIGCYMAHAKAWQEIVNQDLDFALVIEDDCILMDNFNEGLKYLKDTFGKWQYVRLFTNAKPKKIFYTNFEKDGFALVDYVRTTGSGQGQALSKYAAETLLKRTVPFGCPVDTQTHYAHLYGVDVMTLNPPIIDVKGGKTSILNTQIVKVKKHKTFARQRVNIKNYLSRIRYLTKKYEIFKAILAFLKLPFSRPVRHYKMNLNKGVK